MTNRTKRRLDRIVDNIFMSTIFILLYVLGAALMGIDHDSDAYLVGLLLVGLLAYKVDA